MESFSRIDIFDTKGAEYLFVIGYLIFLIVFWNLANKHEGIMKRAKKAISTLTAGFLRIPQGIFYNKYHTWTHLDENGVAKVGLDDFLQHITGRVNFTWLKNPDETIGKGDLLAQIDQDGKQLKIFSPISGRILESNSKLNENPGIFNEDPYKKGWIYKIKPSRWRKDTNSYLLAEDAINWSLKELDRFKDFLTMGPMRKYTSEPSMILLQDGGEIRNNILSDLPGEVWKLFQEEFLDFAS
jgi:glycine cleavage system H protein